MGLKGIKSLQHSEKLKDGDTGQNKEAKGWFYQLLPLHFHY